MESTYVIETKEGYYISSNEKLTGNIENLRLCNLQVIRITLLSELPVIKTLSILKSLREFYDNSMDTEDMEILDFVDC
jgi:hypothetical protein